MNAATQITKQQLISLFDDYEISSFAFHYGDASFTNTSNIGDDELWEEILDEVLSFYGDRPREWKHWEKYNDVELDINITLSVTDGELVETASGIPVGY